MKKTLIPTLIGIILQSSSLFGGSVCDDKLANCGAGCPTAAITANQVSLSISDHGSTNSKILNKMTINGTSFSELVPLDLLKVEFSNKDASHFILENGTKRASSNQSSYSGHLAQSFNSNNLNYYNSQDGGGNRDGDKVKIYYKNLITSTGNRYLMLTERCGNNSQYVYAIDSLGKRISAKRKGKTIYTQGASNYFSTNHFVNGATGEQTLYVAIWPLTSFLTEGKKIAGFVIEQKPSETTTDTHDAGDGKIQLFVKAGSLSCNISAKDDVYNTVLHVGSSTPSVLANDDADGSQATNANIHDNIKITNLAGLPAGTTISTSGRIKIAAGTKSGTFYPIYQICLAKDNDYCDTAKVTLKVQNLPRAVNDKDTTDQGLSVLVDVLHNDTHTDKSEIPKLTIKSSTAGSHGTTSIDRKGTSTPVDDEILYTPSIGYFGVDTFHYTIKDSAGQTSTAEVQITIRKGPDTTIANDTVIEGGALDFRFSLDHAYGADIVYTLNIKDNTTDNRDYDKNTLLEVTVPANTLFSHFILPTIDDPVDEVDSENFTLSIVSTDSDIGDISDTATGFILDNDFSPEAQDDNVVTDEGVPVKIFALANDTHPTTWEKIRIVSAQQGKNGKTYIDTKGTPAPEDDVIIYTPNRGFVGTDSFEYRDRDIQGNEDTAMVYVKIVAAPNVFIEDDKVVEGRDLRFKIRLSRPYGKDTKLSLLATNNTTNDDDHEAKSTDMSVVIKKGTMSSIFVLPTIDDPIDEIDSENLTLSVLRASTAIGDISDTGIGYILDNDSSPIAVNDTKKTDQGLPVNVKVLKNDSHPTKGEKIKIVSSTPGANGTTAIDTKGTVSKYDDEITYTPSDEFSGVDTFEYTIEDLQGNQATATVTIKIRTAPSILIADAKVPEGIFLAFNVTLSHPYGRDIKLNLDYVNNTTNDEDHKGKSSKLEITIPKGRLLVKFRLKTVDDLLVEEQSENLTLKMVAVEPSFLPISDTATGYILDNDFAPRAYDDNVKGINKKPTTVCVLKNDLDGTSDIDKSTLRIFENNSTVSTLTVSNEGIWEVNNDSGCITFTPNEDYIGDPTPIEYYVEDKGTNPVTATVRINYPPLAMPDNLIASVNDEVTIKVLENDKETGSIINKSSVKLIDKNLKEQVKIYIEEKGTFSINDEGAVIFTPDLNFNGIVEIPYTFKEVNGDVSNRATITILYPRLVDDLLLSKYIGGHKDSFDIVGNDSEDIYDISLIGHVNKGSKSKKANTLKLAKDKDLDKNITKDNFVESNATVVTELKVASEGTWSLKGTVITFTPDKEFFGNPTPIRYTARLKDHQINPAKITIIYKKSGPLALDNLGIPVTNHERLVLNVLSNDDFGLHGSGKEIMSWTKPKHGRIVVNEKGTPYNIEDDVLVYKAKSVDYYGTDEFMYTITDARGQTSTARVTLNVSCSSSQPTDGAGVSKYLLLLLFPFILLFRRRKSV